MSVLQIVLDVIQIFLKRKVMERDLVPAFALAPVEIHLSIFINDALLILLDVGGGLPRLIISSGELGLPEDL